MKNRICSKCKKVPSYNSKSICRECNTKYMRTWRQKNKDKWNEYKRKWRMDDYNNNPLTRWKEKANRFVTYRVSIGKIKRMSCEVCNDKNSQAHHDSYYKSHWGNVRWLCQSHHSEWHISNTAKIPSKEKIKKLPIGHYGI